MPQSQSRHILTAGSHLDRVLLRLRKIVYKLFLFPAVVAHRQIAAPIRYLRGEPVSAGCSNIN